MSHSTRECTICNKKVRSDVLGRHFGTHIDNLFLTTKPEYIKTSIHNKMPILFARNHNKIITYAYCVECKGCKFAQSAAISTVVQWIKEHMLSDCMKSWYKHSVRFEAALTSIEFIEDKNTTANKSEMEAVMKELTSTKEELVLVKDEYEDIERMYDTKKETLEAIIQWKDELREAYDEYLTLDESKITKEHMMKLINFTFLKLDDFPVPD